MTIHSNLLVCQQQSTAESILTVDKYLIQPCFKNPNYPFNKVLNIFNIYTFLTNFACPTLAIFKPKLALCNRVHGGVFVWTCCYRLRWEDESQSGRFRSRNKFVLKVLSDTTTQFMMSETRFYNSRKLILPVGIFL